MFRLKSYVIGDQKIKRTNKVRARSSETITTYKEAGCRNRRYGSEKGVQEKEARSKTIFFLHHPAAVNAIIFNIGWSLRFARTIMQLTVVALEFPDV